MGAVFGREDEAAEVFELACHRDVYARVADVTELILDALHARGLDTGALPQQGTKALRDVACALGLLAQGVDGIGIRTVRGGRPLVHDTHQLAEERGDVGPRDALLAHAVAPRDSPHAAAHATERPARMTPAHHVHHVVALELAQANDPLVQLSAGDVPLAQLPKQHVVLAQARRLDDHRSQVVLEQSVATTLEQRGDKRQQAPQRANGDAQLVDGLDVVRIGEKRTQPPVDLVPGDLGGDGLGARCHAREVDAGGEGAGAAGRTLQRGRRGASDATSFSALLLLSPAVINGRARPSWRATRRRWRRARRRRRWR